MVLFKNIVRFFQKAEPAKEPVRRMTEEDEQDLQAAAAAQEAKRVVSLQALQEKATELIRKTEVMQAKMRQEYNAYSEEYWMETVQNKVTIPLLHFLQDIEQNIPALQSSVIGSRNTVTALIQKLQHNKQAGAFVPGINSFLRGLGDVPRSIQRKIEMDNSLPKIQVKQASTMKVSPSGVSTTSAEPIRNISYRKIY